jgi:hypothetical protein
MPATGSQRFDFARIEAIAEVLDVVFDLTREILRRERRREDLDELF